MEIELVKIDDLRPAEYNPRKISEKQMDELKASLKKFGFVDPIICNSKGKRKNIIIGGHQMMRAWKEMGHEDVPVFYISLTEKQEMELNVRLNKSGGEFDHEKLLSFYHSDDLMEYGFEEEELSLYMDDEEFGDDFNLEEGEKDPFQNLTFKLSDTQAERIQNAIKKAKGSKAFKSMERFENENENGNALYLIISEWAEQKK